MPSLPKLRRLTSHRLVQNTAALFVIQVTTNVAPLLVLPYLSRILTTEHFGLIAFATGFNWYFLTLVEYGFNLTATRRISISRDDPEKVSLLFSSVMFAKGMLTVLGFILMLAVVLLTKRLRPDLPLFCLSYLAVVGDFLFPVWLFQGLEKMKNLVWRDLLAKLISLSLIFAFVRHDEDYLLAAGFQAGSMMVAGIVGLITVPLVTPVRWLKPNLAEALRSLREGWSVFLSMAAGSVTYSTNLFLLNVRSGPADVAYYSAAYRLIVAVRMLVSPVVTAVYPHISHMAAKSRSNAVEFLRRYALILAAPFLVMGLVLIAAAPLVVRFYGAKYTPAAILLQILAMSPFLLALQNTYSTFFMLGFGYEKEYSNIVLRATILNFLIVIPLLYLMWPPMAVCITGICIEAFMTLATYLFYKRHREPALAPVAV